MDPFICLHVDIAVQRHLFKRLSFLHWIVLWLLSKIIWPCMWGFISGHSIPLVYILSLFQCHTVLITVALYSFSSQRTSSLRALNEVAISVRGFIYTSRPSDVTVTAWARVTVTAFCWDRASPCSIPAWAWFSRLSFQWQTTLPLKSAYINQSLFLLFATKNPDSTAQFIWKWATLSIEQ